MQFSTKIDGFEQKDSQGFEKLVQLLWTIPIREIFHFHHLPKLYFGFKSSLLFQTPHNSNFLFKSK